MSDLTTIERLERELSAARAEAEAVKRHALTCLVVDCPVRSHLAIAAYRPAPAEPECKHGAWPLCKDDPPCGDCPKCKPAPRAEGK